MPTRDQVAVAQLEGHAERCVRNGASADAAVAGLHEISTAPAVLAQAAGILAGTARRGSDYKQRIAAARLLVAAGADCRHLPHWIGVGRYNATRPTGPGGVSDWPNDLDQVFADVVNGPAG